MNDFVINAACVGAFMVLVMLFIMVFMPTQIIGG
jgi:hypothetical protein